MHLTVLTLVEHHVVAHFYCVNMNIPYSAVKTHLHTNYTRHVKPTDALKCLAIVVMCVKTTKQAVMIGFDLIQCYKPAL